MAAFEYHPAVSLHVTVKLSSDATFEERRVYVRGLLDRVDASYTDMDVTHLTRRWGLEGFGAMVRGVQAHAKVNKI